VKMIIEVLIKIFSHCTNNCNNTCIVYMFHHSQLTDDPYGLYSFAGRVSTIPFTSLFPKYRPSPVPINFNPTPALSNVLYVHYQCTFSIFWRRSHSLNSSFRKEFNAGGIHTPVNNSLSHNDFITVVQQRHCSYSYRQNF
jgi:hypothetical protein